ncbi:hypothetical protein GPJ56_007835 [Histomonas meleagridis]|uniref:uncharacterized protein n=1 Tax=Histomonas meleagridis TaxID=135588 RepID=UPI003559EF29|nr:hypothetical protein GPJ56_007835 [Histomonas meleagridis]KAH0800266.1 hypothetical protein GO595_007378 [Histomonas meleagridis]
MNQPLFGQGNQFFKTTSTSNPSSTTSSSTSTSNPFSTTSSSTSTSNPFSTTTSSTSTSNPFSTTTSSTNTSNPFSTASSSTSATSNPPSTEQSKSTLGSGLFTNTQSVQPQKVKRVCPNEIMDFISHKTDDLKPPFVRDEVIMWSVILEKSQNNEKIEKLEYEFPPAVTKPTEQKQTTVGFQSSTTKQAQPEQKIQVKYENSFDAVSQEPAPILTSAPYFLPTEKVGSKKKSSLDFSHFVSHKTTKPIQHKENFSNLFLPQVSPVLDSSIESTSDINEWEPLRITPEQIKFVSEIKFDAAVNVTDTNLPPNHLKCYNDEGEIYFLHIQNIPDSTLKQNVDISTHFISVSDELKNQLGPAIITINKMKLELEEDPESYLQRKCQEMKLDFISFQKETENFSFFACDFENVPFQF